MTRKWQWVLRQFGKRLWLRAVFFGAMGVFTALFALLVKDYIPAGFTQKVGADAVDNILQIIANSMLAVTTFSLSIMVAAYSSASGSVTPRSTQLLLNDTTAQNALSVFIGAFLFSIVSIVALKMEVYGESGRLILFAATIFVIVVIICVLLRWISYLSGLGRMGNTIDMVERATIKSLHSRMEHPYLGGRPLRHDAEDDGRYPVHCGEIGYVQHVDMSALSKLAEDMNAAFYMCMTPGAFNDGVAPLLFSTVRPDEKTLPRACKAFAIGDGRDFEQDPRFALSVMSEIALRALSPATNDPGTAIDILGRSVRILSPWVARDVADPEPLYPNIFVPPLSAQDMFDDMYLGIARDGGGAVEIGIRLQKALISLSRKGDAETKSAARALSRRAYDYAEKMLVLDAEKKIIKELSATLDA